MSDEQSNSALGGPAAEALRQFIERIQRLNEEIKTLNADKADVYSHAKSMGFDVKTIRSIVKLLEQTEQEREEAEQLLDLYKHALGMLRDTPLGDWALKKQSRDGEADDAGRTAKPAKPAAPALPPELADKTPDEARQLGRAAARDGSPVTGNPFPARDARRAAWDEGWCKEKGSDGLDIPDQFRRKSPDNQRKDAA